MTRLLVQKLIPYKLVSRRGQTHKTASKRSTFFFIASGAPCFCCQSHPVFCALRCTWVSDWQTLLGFSLLHCKHASSACDWIQNISVCQNRAGNAAHIIPDSSGKQLIMVAVRNRLPLCTQLLVNLKLLRQGQDERQEAGLVGIRDSYSTGAGRTRPLFQFWQTALATVSTSTPRSAPSSDAQPFPKHPSWRTRTLRVKGGALRALYGEASDYDTNRECNIRRSSVFRTFSTLVSPKCIRWWSNVFTPTE